MDIVSQDWSVGRRLMDQFGFDGFEIYPTPGYPLETIPPDLARGLHLRFFVMLWDLWRGDLEGLRATFGDLETARLFYGGLERQAVVDCYAGQLAWGRQVGAEYAVFHAAQADLRGLMDWRFPWTWQETIDMSAEIVNQACAGRAPGMPILFENLWWPGGLRLLERAEVERLAERLTIDDWGLALDTGHLLNTNPDLADEAQGVDYIVKVVRDLGPLARRIRAVHLTRSLSGHYVRQCQSGQVAPPPAEGDFWDRMAAAQIHVGRIDQHEAFETAEIGRLFELIEPDWVVFEFTYHSLDHWRGKIARQCAATAGLFDGRPRVGKN